MYFIYYCLILFCSIASKQSKCEETLHIHSLQGYIYIHLAS